MSCSSAIIAVHRAVDDRAAVHGEQVEMRLCLKIVAARIFASIKVIGKRMRDALAGVFDNARAPQNAPYRKCAVAFYGRRSDFQINFFHDGLVEFGVKTIMLPTSFPAGDKACGNQTKPNCI